MSELLKDKFAEKKINSEKIYSGKIVRLFKDKVLLSNGKETSREVIRHNGAVAVVPITDDGKVIMVRQYRYAVDKMMLEIPAGKLDSADEVPLEAAKRELSEETGITAKKISFLGSFYGSPAILDEKIYMYVATELTFGNIHLDEGEFVETKEMPINELINMIANGEITDGKTQSAIMMAALKLGYLQNTVSDDSAKADTKK